MNRPWQYLTNQFLSATVGNYSKMMKISNQHDSFLKARKDQYPSDLDYAELYDSYHPVHQLYVTKYTTWKGAGGTHKGQTLNLVQMLELLTENVQYWDIQVQNLEGFRKGSVNYTTLFPQGHYPFHSGSYMSRINAVNVLGEAMAAFPDNPGIVNIKVFVDQFYLDIDAVRDNQENTISNTQGFSEQVEAQRKVVAQALYSDLCFLLNKFSSTPLEVGQFFNLRVLRNTEQVIYSGTIAKNDNKAVLIHTFLADDELSIVATNSYEGAPATDMTFYLASMLNGTDSDPVVIVANAPKTTLDVSAFGITDYAAHRFLTVVNSSIYELHYTVELL